jgi:hypothetical protein|tara:strand:+ start:388 stop:537 length:150 start_codon:yes stop_codon:yes gene_type:complete
VSKKITVEVEGDDAEILVEYLANIERLLTEIRDALAKKPAPRTRRKTDG